MQVNETEPVKPVVEFNAMVAVAWPPGSTPADGENAEAVSVKFCRLGKRALGRDEKTYKYREYDCA